MRLYRLWLAKFVLRLSLLSLRYAGIMVTPVVCFKCKWHAAFFHPTWVVSAAALVRHFSSCSTFEYLQLLLNRLEPGRTIAHNRVQPQFRVRILSEFSLIAFMSRHWLNLDEQFAPWFNLVATTTTTTTTSTTTQKNITTENCQGLAVGLKCRLYGNATLSAVAG